LSKLLVERLEQREVPAITQVGDQLVVQGESSSPNVVVIDNNETGGISVHFNGVISDYQNVTSVAVLGGDRDDYIRNNTELYMTARAGGGDDYLHGGSRLSNLTGGEGSDVIICVEGRGAVNSFDSSRDVVCVNKDVVVYSDKRDKITIVDGSGPLLLLSPANSLEVLYGKKTSLSRCGVQV
jgi:Ca2+-binding RTX toxin-like protein